MYYGQLAILSVYLFFTLVTRVKTAKSSFVIPAIMAIDGRASLLCIDNKTKMLSNPFIPFQFTSVFIVFFSVQ